MIYFLIRPIIIITTVLSSFFAYSNRAISSNETSTKIEESNRYFNCISENSEIVTTFQTQHNEIDLINWQDIKSLIDENNISKACLEVSSRLQRFIKNGNADYISVGTLNNQSFLCVADKFGNCTGNNFGFLISLNKNTNTEQILENFFSPSLIEKSQGNSQKKVVNLNPPIVTNSPQFSSSESNEDSENTTGTKPQTSIQYSCLNKSGEKPVTIVDTKRGKIELIIWKSQFFASSGYTPQRRCNQVTARFQKHSDQKTLRYISTGTMNGQKVICVAKNDAGDCRNDGLLITLEPKDDANHVLRELFNLRERANSGGIYRAFGGEQLKEVIVWDDFLERKLNN